MTPGQWATLAIVAAAVTLIGSVLLAIAKEMFDAGKDAEKEGKHDENL